MALKITDFKTPIHNDWCPGCGDFGILSSLQMAFTDMQLEPHNVALFSGIGCSGKTHQYMNTYGIHTLHGRVLPFATGAKLANPDLNVIAVGGDGDGLGIGSGHFVNAGRRNVDFTYVLFNNGVYGLTKGQASPTLKLGLQPKSLPKPNIVEAINPILLAFSAGYTFIARGYSFDVKHLKELIIKGIKHRGSAFIDVLQPCPTYNNLNTQSWFSEVDQNTKIPRTYKLEEIDYDPVIKESDDENDLELKINQLVKKATEWGDKIPLGVYYQNETVSTFEERIISNIPNYRSQNPVKQLIHSSKGHGITDLTKHFDELTVS